MSSTNPDAGALFPIPAGTRDTLPEEMAELRELLAPFHRTLQEASYGEIHTPTLEYEDVLDVGDVASTEPSFRLFDEGGRTLVLRSDMTIPVARVVATRLREQPAPYRLYYVAHVYRLVRARLHQRREFLQAGAELIGVPGTAGTLEVLHALAKALNGMGLSTFKITVGHAGLLPELLHAFDLAGAEAEGLLHEVVTRDFVGLRRKLSELESAGRVSPEVAQLLDQTAQRRGGPEVLESANSAVHEAMRPLRDLWDGADTDLRARLMFDLGLVRQLGYYTAEIFEIHHPALGAPLGGGGRYDGLLERFGLDLPSVGFGLTVDFIHQAAMAEAHDGPS